MQNLLKAKPYEKDCIDSQSDIGTLHTTTIYTKTRLKHRDSCLDNAQSLRKNCTGSSSIISIPKLILVLRVGTIKTHLLGNGNRIPRVPCPVKLKRKMLQI